MTTPCFAHPQLPSFLSHTIMTLWPVRFILLKRGIRTLIVLGFAKPGLQGRKESAAARVQLQPVRERLLGLAVVCSWIIADNAPQVHVRRPEVAVEELVRIAGLKAAGSLEGAKGLDAVAGPAKRQAGR